MYWNSGISNMHLNDFTSGYSGAIFGTYSSGGMNIKSSDNGTSCSTSTVPELISYTGITAGKIK